MARSAWLCGIGIVAAGIVVGSAGLTAQSGPGANGADARVVRTRTDCGGLLHAERRAALTPEQREERSRASETALREIGLFAAAAAAPQAAPDAYIELPWLKDPLPRWKAWYFCAGDFNRDDAIDGEDVAAYVQAYSSLEGPVAELLDVSRDGVVDVDDLIRFVQGMSDGCDPKATAEHRDHVC